MRSLKGPVKALLLLFFGFTSPSLGTAQTQAQLCFKVHLPKPVQPAKVWERPGSQTLPIQSELKPTQLKKFGFHLSPDQKQLLDTQTGKVIGDVYLIPAQYLFQWGDRPNHEAMLADKGISPEYMKDVLEARGQVAGKGFYVSLDPLDSQSYGDSVTQFKTKGPVVVLSVGYTFSGAVGSDTAFVSRLAQAGIDALSAPGYRRTWLSMIHHRRLQGASRLTADVADTLIEEQSYNAQTRGAITNFPEKFPLEFWKQYPKDSTLGQLMRGEPLPWRDLVQLSQNYRSLTDSTGKFAHAFGEFIFRAQTPEEMITVLTTVRNLKLKNEALADFQKSIFARNKKPLAKTYRSVLDFFGMNAVASLADPQQQGPKLERMKKASEKYSSQRSQFELSEIETTEQLLQVASKIYGRKFQFRDSDAFMGKSDQNGPKMIELNWIAAAGLSRFDLLKTVKSPQLLPSGNQLHSVNYFGLDRIQKVNATFSQALAATVGPVGFGFRFDMNQPEYKKLLQDILKDQTQSILSNQNAFGNSYYTSNLKTPDHFFRHFSILHPFVDGNAQMGRLVHEIISEKKRAYYEETPELHLPIEGLELFIHEERFNDFNIMGTLLKAWVLDAPNDREFVNRNRTAMEIFFRMHPEFQTLPSQLESVP